MSRVLVVLCTLVATALSAAGCSTYWGQRPLDQPTPVDSNHPVWIWSRGAVNKWYGVVVTQDSVSGVSYEMPLNCNSCRRILPRTQVDSIKVGYAGSHTTAKDVVVGVGVVAAVVAADVLFEYIDYVICSALDTHPSAMPGRPHRF